MTTMYKRSLFRRRHESLMSFSIRKIWESAKIYLGILALFGLAILIQWMIMQRI